MEPDRDYIQQPAGSLLRMFRQTARVEIEPLERALKKLPGTVGKWENNEEAIDPVSIPILAAQLMMNDRDVKALREAMGRDAKGANRGR